MNNSGLKDSLIIWILLLLAMVAGCGPSPEVVERPETPPSSRISDLLPQGHRSPFSYYNSLEGEKVSLPDNSWMVALRYASSEKSLSALRFLNQSYTERREITSRSIITTGSSSYLTYSGKRLHGIAWTSGVWLFIAEADSEERLNNILAASKAGGYDKSDAFVSRNFGWIFTVAFILGLAGTYVMTNVIARWMGVPPKKGVVPVGRDELLNSLMALNNAQIPFTVREDTKSDLVAEWKIVDAAWWGVFHKAGLKEAYRMRLALDKRRHEVRVLEDYGSTEWLAGSEGLTPKVYYQKRFFRGIVLFRYERGWAYGLKSVTPPEVGKIYDFKFDVREIKEPIITTVIEAGWRFSPVLWAWQVRRSR